MSIASIPSQKYVPSDLIFYYIPAFYCSPEFAQPLPPTVRNPSPFPPPNQTTTNTFIYFLDFHVFLYIIFDFIPFLRPFFFSSSPPNPIKQLQSNWGHQRTKHGPAPVQRPFCQGNWTNIWKWNENFHCVIYFLLFYIFFFLIISFFCNDGQGKWKMLALRPYTYIFNVINLYFHCINYK